jgi:hypothetical protein
MVHALNITQIALYLMHPTGAPLPQVKRDENYSWNTDSPYVFIEKCARYNIMILPHTPWTNDGPDKDVFDVIDRHRTFEEKED